MGTVRGRGRDIVQKASGAFDGPSGCLRRSAGPAPVKCAAAVGDVAGDAASISHAKTPTAPSSGLWRERSRWLSPATGHLTAAESRAWIRAPSFRHRPPRAAPDGMEAAADAVVFGDAAESCALHHKEHILDFMYLMHILQSSMFFNLTKNKIFYLCFLISYKVHYLENMFLNSCSEQRKAIQTSNKHVSREMSIDR